MAKKKKIRDYFAQREARMSALPQDYLWSEQMDSQMQATFAQYPSGDYYHCFTDIQGNTVIQEPDLNHIQQLLSDSKKDFLVFPKLRGNHFSYLALIRKPRNDEWVAYDIAVPADGSCGSHVVEGVKKIAEQPRSERSDEWVKRTADVQKSQNVKTAADVQNIFNTNLQAAFSYDDCNDQDMQAVFAESLRVANYEENSFNKALFELGCANIAYEKAAQNGANKKTLELNQLAGQVQAHVEKIQSLLQEMEQKNPGRAKRALTEFVKSKLTTAQLKKFESEGNNLNHLLTEDFQNGQSLPAQVLQAYKEAVRDNSSFKQGSSLLVDSMTAFFGRQVGKEARKQLAEDSGKKQGQQQSPLLGTCPK